MFATRTLRQSKQLPAAAEQLYASYKETANQFKSYNFKEYFLRQADRKFQQTFPFEANAQETQAYLQQAERDLNVLRRAALVNALYEAPRLVVEKGVSPGEMSHANQSPEEVERGRDSI